ncbi:MAG: TRAP transporter small permease [Hyphomicrobiaceae bacterium]|nr:TRAP transporter small permease [Hyphomicrobiaceae bacterium]
MLPPAPYAPMPLRALGILVDWAVVIIGAVMVALVFTNVLFRLWGGDIAFTTELCELLMVWVTFLGGAAATRRGLHMTITEFLDKLGPEARRWADAAIQVLTLLLLALLVWYGMGVANASWGNELTVLHLPMALQYLGLPVGAGLMAIYTAWDLLLILRGQSREERYRMA